MSEASVAERKASAEFYDSHRALPVKGSVTIIAGTISFVPDVADGNTYSYNADEIKNVKSTPDSVRVRLGPPGEHERSVLLVIHDITLRKTLGRMYRDAYPVSGLTQQIFNLPFGIKILLLVTVVPLSIIFFMQILEKTHLLVPDAVDQMIGRKVATEIDRRYEVCDDKELNNVLKSLTAKLIKPGDRFNPEVTIIKSKRVNAFALPSGRIYFFSGLLEESQSEEEVAGILAHEIGHAELRHGIKTLINSAGVFFMISTVTGAGFEGVGSAETISELASTFLYLSYSRESEREADAFALSRLQEAELSLSGIVDFLNRNGVKSKTDPKEEGATSIRSAFEWLSTHPSDDARLNFFKTDLEKEKFTPIDHKKWRSIRSRCS